MNYKDYLKLFIGKRGFLNSVDFGYVFNYGSPAPNPNVTITEVHDDVIICVTTGPNFNKRYAIPISSFILEEYINDGLQGTNISK